MATLADIRAKLLEQQQSTSQSTSDNAIYPFWNIQTGQSTLMRFLPDADEENTFFWKERQMVRLAFPGIKDQDEHKNVTVQVPCIEMWGETCPIHAEIRPWFKDPSLEDEARKYWKKRSYIYQGFVVDSPMTEDQVPENPIRRFVINPGIHKIITAALMDPEFEEVPTDYEKGTDFKLVKTQQGQYADYSTSNWARKERSLNETERAAIETNGLFTLNDYMPKKPSETELKVIFEMFEASVDGQLYDPERWADYYKPYGLKSNGNTTTGSSSVTPTPQPTATETSEASATEVTDKPFEDGSTSSEPVTATVTADPSADGKKPDAKEILAMIRNRKTEQAQ
mgnify:FL=1